MKKRKTFKIKIKTCNDCKANRRKYVKGNYTDSDILILFDNPIIRKPQNKSYTNYKKILELFQDLNPSYDFLTKCTFNSYNLQSAEICYQKYIKKVIKKFKIIVLTSQFCFSFFFPGYKYDAIGIGNFISKKIDNKELKFYSVGWDILLNKKYVNRLKKYLAGTLYNKKYKIITTDKEFKEYAKIIKTKSIVGFDMENNTTNPFQPGWLLYSMAISWKKDFSVCFPYEHPEFKDIILRNKFKNFISGLLVSKNIRKVIHNAKYDIKMTRAKGFPDAQNVACTWLMAYLRNERRKYYKLKTLVPEFLDGYADIVLDFEDTQLSRLGYYNNFDADMHLQLYNLFYNDFSGKLRYAFEEICSIMPTLFADIELNGIKIDLKYLTKLSKTLKMNEKKILHKLYKIEPSLKKINLDSHQQLGDVLFNKLKRPIIEKTPQSKQPKLNETILKILSVKYHCKISEQILKLRKNHKFFNTYVKKVKSDWLYPDGKTRCDYLITGTTTGRPAGQNPNLLNIPRDKRIKNYFIADKNCNLFQIDFSQAELRIMASLSNDKAMINEYNKKNPDLHTLTAVQISNKRPEDIEYEDRQKGKVTNFGLIYLMSAKSLMNDAKYKYNVKMTLPEAQKYHDNWFKKYKNVREFHNKIAWQIKTKYYVESPFGRRRRFPELKNEKILYQDDFNNLHRQAVNFPIQSTASDITVSTLYKLYLFLKKYKMKSKIILTVYDSGILNAYPDEIEDIYYLVKDLENMIKYDWLKVPMIIDCSIGNRWGELKDYKGGKL